MIEWLYRKNNNEQPCCWSAELQENMKDIVVRYGIVGKTIRNDVYKVVQKDAVKEIASRYNDKRKQGYMYLSEIKDDNGTPPVKDKFVLYDYLSAYLPSYRNNENNGAILPMLAKTYSGNVWKKVPVMLGQYKINGLRCLISAYKTNDLFRSVRLRFQSREGIIWNSLDNLEDYLLDILPCDFINNMVENNWSIDGEIYLPGHTINEINHFVKDVNCKENKLLQFWCYDIAIQDMVQHKRNEIRAENLPKAKWFYDKESHLNNTDRLINLGSYEISTDKSAVTFRDKFIKAGFEGLILRNPNVDYQFGRRRVGYMEKFKDKTDGKFIIIDIQREQKRNLPIIVCQNDINNETFKTRFSYPHAQQEEILNHKEDYIGKYVFIKFGERSGIGNVPFHIKEVYLI
jgi:hypothetical protein